ncbi:hypothetical protein Scep_025461 [Stephania cephalantha]|uniref:Uncharacterized protein n=1 Tax=Stephania cephalantha TaxID=152367 RepID=A0AAP0ENI4_9MAGN
MEFIPVNNLLAAGGSGAGKIAKEFLVLNMYAGNPAMASYSHNYGRSEYSHYYNVNGVEENVSADTLNSVEVNEVTQVKDNWSETAEGLEVFQIESEIIIALDEEVKNEMKIEVISERPEEPQKESKEDQPLVLNDTYLDKDGCHQVRMVTGADRGAERGGGGVIGNGGHRRRKEAEGAENDGRLCLYSMLMCYVNFLRFK